MTVLSPPRHPIVAQALRDAAIWCAGQVIDQQPALVHAVRVAVTIGDYVPAPAPEIIAAALLHDVPEFAPAHVDLTRVLAARYGPEVPRIIMALQAEHNALDGPDPVVKVNDPSVLLTSTADKIVALTSLLRRARASGDVTAFFAVRPALLRLLPHFRAFHDSGRGLVPAGMSQALAAVLDRIEQAAAHVIVQ